MKLIRLLSSLVYGLACCLIILTLFLPSSLYAQNFLYKKLAVAKHQKKSSSSKFKLKEKLFGGPNPELGIKDIDLDVPGYIFSNSNLPISAGSYDGLPKCSKSKTRELVREEKSLSSLDVVVYQFGKDDKKAKSYTAIPYIEGALENPFRPSGDEAQTIIRNLGVQCLPTRVKSVKINGKNGFKYFEGKDAWKK